MTIFLAGHRGMVGSAILQKLRLERRPVMTCDRKDLDLTDQKSVRTYMRDTRPDAVILAAAKVGGIHANETYPADFISENLMIQTNIIREAYLAGVQKLLFLGSSCIYPVNAAQPMREDALLTGRLESTNEPYAIAKIAGIKMCESYNRQHGVDFRSVMPTNLYGPGDNFHPENSHVLPALIRRFHEAKQATAEVVTVWGSGAPRREFLHVEDMAEASLFVHDLEHNTWEQATSPLVSHLNVGTGTDISIRDLATLVAGVTGFQGDIVYDTSRPDGSAQKLLDVSCINELGWHSSVTLEQGLRQTYDWFLAQDVTALRA